MGDVGKEKGEEGFPKTVPGETSMMKTKLSLA